MAVPGERNASRDTWVANIMTFGLPLLCNYTLTGMLDMPIPVLVAGAVEGQCIIVSLY